MGEKLEISIYNGVAQFLTSPGIPFIASGNIPDFVIFLEVKNMFEENEEETDNIVGYEVLDIATVKESDIPDIPELYDVVDTNLKDMTIKEIVMAVKDVYLKQRTPDHNVA